MSEWWWGYTVSGGGSHRQQRHDNDNDTNNTIIINDNKNNNLQSSSSSVGRERETGVHPQPTAKQAATSNNNWKSQVNNEKNCANESVHTYTRRREEITQHLLSLARARLKKCESSDAFFLFSQHHERKCISSEGYT